MKKLYFFLKIIILYFIFTLLKIISGLIKIDIVFLYRIIEGFQFLILSFCFLIFTDDSREDFKRKIIISIITAFSFSILSVLISFIKNIFISSNIFSGIINYTIFLLLAGLPFIRDRFIYKFDELYIFLKNIIIIAYFLTYKLILNLFFNLVLKNNVTTGFAFSLIGLFIFCLIFFLIKPIVYSFFVNGFLKIKNKFIPIYNSIRIGRSKYADYLINNYDSKKAFCFTITAVKKWRLNPAVEIKLNNNIIKSGTELKNNDKIKIDEYEFQVVKKRNNFFKKLLIILFSVFYIFISAKKDSDWELINKKSVVIDKIDYSFHNLVYAYISAPEDTLEKLKNENNIFIIEGDKAVKIEKIESQKMPVDIVFLLDKTGSMYEEFKRIRKNLPDFSNNLKKLDRKVRIGIITFSDHKNEIDFLDLNENIEETVYFIKKIDPSFGGDYKENPYDSIKALDEMSFEDLSLKVIVLFTDAPAHVKGEEDPEGKEYTEYTNEDIKLYLDESGYLFYVISYKEIEEYQELINKNQNLFYDIEKYDNFSGIISKLEESINLIVRISYYSRQSLNFYKKDNRDIRIFINKDAEKARKLYEKRKTHNTSFFKSLFEVF